MARKPPSLVVSPITAAAASGAGAPEGKKRGYDRRCSGRSAHGRTAVVRKGGLEPPRLAASEPKSGASTNSATFAMPQAPNYCYRDADKEKAPLPSGARLRYSAEPGASSRRCLRRTRHWNPVNGSLSSPHQAVPADRGLAAGLPRRHRPRRADHVSQRRWLDTYPCRPPPGDAGARASMAYRPHRTPSALCKSAPKAI